MKRYILTNNKTGAVTEYSYSFWQFIWVFVFIVGIITGMNINKYSIENMELKNMNYDLILMNDSLIDQNTYLLNVINNFMLFSDSLIKTESGHDTTIVNINTGAIGAPQLMPETIKYLGYNIDLTDFVNNPSCFPGQLQYEIFLQLLDSNHFYFVKNNVYDYVGQQIDSVTITKSGLLAAAHIGGAYGTKKFIETNGKYNPSDGHNRISDYMYKFANFKF